MSVGSTATVTATQVDHEGIRIQGSGGTIVIEGQATLSAQAEAINGNRFNGKAQGWAIDNAGTVLTFGGHGDATIRTGEDAKLIDRSGGVISRTSTPGETAFISGVSVNAGSTFVNQGLVSVATAVNDTHKAQTAVELATDTHLVNSGTISISGAGEGIGVFTVSFASTPGLPYVIENTASEVIDAEFGNLAIEATGIHPTTVTNLGQIIGGSVSGEAIYALGGDFHYTQGASGSTVGNVRAYDSYAGRIYFTEKATLEFHVDAPSAVVQDQTVTEYFGFNTIILDGDGDLSFEQDFIRGEVQPSRKPTGHFGAELTFNVQDPDGTVTVSGTIADQPNLGYAAVVQKEGLGTLHLTGNSTFTGEFEIYDRTVVVDGSVAAPTFVRWGGGLTGSGVLGGKVVLDTRGKIVSDGKTSVLTFGELEARAESVIQIDADESGGSLNADAIMVNGAASFESGTVVDVVFDANATLPALSGINIINAANGVSGYAPDIQLNPASLPNGQNFSLDLEATNFGGTFATPGQAIPTGAGGAGVVVLKVESHDQLPPQPVQVVVINKPVQLPTTTPIVITPVQTPTTTPSLVKGTGSNVTVPVVTPPTGGTVPQTGIVVAGGGTAQIGGTVTPSHQSATGVPHTPTKQHIGSGSKVVSTTPPQGTTGVTGTYHKVDQKHSGTGGKHVLVYHPNSVQTHYVPQNHGNLAALGVSQTKPQQAVGQAVSSTLPQAHARPTTTGQSSLVMGLYPLAINKINPALDSIAGVGEDPTFVTVLNTRSFQDAMDSRLRDRRDGRVTVSVQATQGSDQPVSDRSAWGEFLGNYAQGDYLNESEITTWGLILGADQTVSENTIAGVAIAYSDADIDVDTGSSDEVQSFEIAAYGDYTSNDWFVTGSIGYSYNTLDMRHAVIIGTTEEILTGDTEANSFFAGIEAGKIIPTTWGTLEPTVGLRYQYVDRDGYTESGNSSLTRKVSSDKLSTGQGILGLRAYGDYKASGGMMWRPEVRIAYGRELGESDINGRASLVSAPGSSFDVMTAGPGENIGIFGLRLEGKGDKANYYLDYQGEARDSLYSHQVRAGLSLDF